MITDFYALQYGPVPSELFNYLKSNNEITSAIIIDDEAKYILSPIEYPDMDYLSKVDVQCLNESINENYGLPFYDLTKKSHDAAWHTAWNNTVGKRGSKMDIVDIAMAAGADKRTIEHIREELEFEAALR
jgi:uncharacterized phage-associated protein